MKAMHINPFLTSVSSVLQMVAGVEATKGEIKKGEGIQSENTHTLFFEVQKELSGFFAISFNDEVAMNLVEKMVGTRPEVLDEMSLSALKEIAEMVKGNAITELSTIGIDCEATETKFKEQDDAVEGDSIVLTMESELGNIDNLFYIKK